LLAAGLLVLAAGGVFLKRVHDHRVRCDPEGDHPCSK
jgi:hypothetical protein